MALSQTSHRTFLATFKSIPGNAIKAKIWFVSWPNLHLSVCPRLRLGSTIKRDWLMVYRNRNRSQNSFPLRREIRPAHSANKGGFSAKKSRITPPWIICIILLVLIIISCTVMASSI
ncbi:hypothetical protein LX36DRAFT_158516 [Colletotrichum falcatum]|nr:hypothetical protein LX36DRAFT_158516 [Colletotrichum falcatum]